MNKDFSDYQERTQYLKILRNIEIWKTKTEQQSPSVESDISSLNNYL